MIILGDKIRILLQTTRPAFLLLTPVCVFLGFSISAEMNSIIEPVHIFMVLLGALLAHISVNTLNEYLDFKSGLDAMTKRTPFSGGSGALLEQPSAAQSVLYLSIAAMAGTILIGIYFVVLRGFSILPIGLIGIVIILAYTRWINRLPLFCLIAPGLCFGPLMVTGTAYVLSGTYFPSAFYISLVPFFLTNNLLLLNQFPDIEADKKSGRKHIPIVYGTRAATYIYGVFALVVCLIIFTSIGLELLSAISFISLIPMIGAVVALVGAWRHASDINRLSPYLAANVMAALLTPLLLGFSLFMN